MKPVFIWTDIGTNPDDTLAVLMAIRSDELNILDISTIFDFDGQRAEFLKALLKAEGEDLIPRLFF